MDKQMCYIPTLEYYLAIKRNKIMINATAWINLKNIMLVIESNAKD